MVVMFPLPLMIVLSVWLTKLSPFKSRGNRIALLITESFHIFFVVSVLYVWMVTGTWGYAVAAAVALLPVVMYAVRSKILLRTNEGLMKTQTI
jgi:hypothetical protein